MVELTLLDALSPFVNIMGGIAGLSLAYFAIVLIQNKRKLKRLERVEEELRHVRRTQSQLLREQRQLTMIYGRIAWLRQRGRKL